VSTKQVSNLDENVYKWSTEYKHIYWDSSLEELHHFRGRQSTILPDVLEENLELFFRKKFVGTTNVDQGLVERIFLDDTARLDGLD
jgi:hypothetical protein